MKKLILIATIIATPAIADGPSSPWDRPQLTVPHPGHLCYSAGWQRENPDMWETYCIKFELAKPKRECTTIRFEVEGATPRWQTKEICE